jgi:hypothetical protein
MLRGFVGAVIAIAAASLALAEKTEIAINPGLPAMTPEEAAIVADPAAGTQHAVVLLEETDRDEARGTGYVLTYHLRAKVLSPEGRALGDVEIPVSSPTELKKWWGRTILPDGKVLELTEAELSRQAVAKTSLGKTVTLKGALPGIVPGAVIDYGTSFGVRGTSRIRGSSSSRNGPYGRSSSAGCPLRNRRVVHVHPHGWAQRQGHAGRDVRPRGRMGPQAGQGGAVHAAGGRGAAAVTFYYGNNDKMDEYWELEAKRADTRIKSFASGSVVREAIAGMNIPVDAPLPARLAAAYDWIGANITNTWFKTAEQVDAVVEDEDEQASTAKSVLKAKEGTGYQLDLLFASVARGLGAESALIYAVDRTERYWNRGWKSSTSSTTRSWACAAATPRTLGRSSIPGPGFLTARFPGMRPGAPRSCARRRGCRGFAIPPATGPKNRTDTNGDDRLLGGRRDHRRSGRAWVSDASGMYYPPLAPPPRSDREEGEARQAVRRKRIGRGPRRRASGPRSALGTVPGGVRHHGPARRNVTEEIRDYRFAVLGAGGRRHRS